ncbi:YciI family protein [Cumulibacter soli]|uniref:YciI family protein n=1 Tax=Cumulibacter soli TaxID=2546344 RepID=UPI001068C672|nr:YciI family protein [Cumulibacter soli]
MKYLVLLMGYGEGKSWDDQSEQEQADEMRQHAEFDEACAAHDGVQILAGEALAPDMVTTVRTRSGNRMITDGPYAEAVEQLGGFYLLEAPDLDVVLELLSVMPRYDIQITPAVDVP